MANPLAVLVVFVVATALPALFFFRYEAFLTSMSWTAWNQIALYFAGFAVVSFLALQFVAAPYGRYQSDKWGPSIPAWIGWILMEVPSPVLTTLYVHSAFPRLSVTQLVFAGMWLVHYANRAFIYPLRASGKDKPMTLITIVSSVLFNYPNPILNASYLFTMATYPDSYLVRWNFVLGAALWAVGFYVNLQSDAILRSLRKKSTDGYSIPHGGLFEYVSCANYFGEFVEWSGFALATLSPAALIFALWTAANLAPRARQHHAWYQRKFADYPRNRTAFLPFVF